MPHPDLTTAIDIVSAACRIARTVQADLDDIRAHTKDDRSPVTVADFAVQALVTRRLRDAFGDALMVGEEHADALRDPANKPLRDAVIHAVRSEDHDADADAILDAIDGGDHDGSAEAYWTLDPIDGTKGFLRGQQYAIALAHIENGQVRLGVMGCPNLPLDHGAALDVADPHGSIYAAVAGAGSVEINPVDMTDRSRSIHAHEFADDASIDHIRTCESVEKSHSKQSDTQRVLETLGVDVRPVRLDSQCKYALVARGQADAYLRLPTSRTYVEKIWDHAAGMLIATEAGARVSDITGAPLDFTHGRRLEANRGVICAAPGLHERIIETIASLGIGAAV